MRAALNAARFVFMSTIDRAYQKWYNCIIEYGGSGNQTAVQRSVYGSAGETSGDANLAGWGSDTGTGLYRYDSFNRLTEYITNAGSTSYTYGADNLRTSKTVNGERTDFSWNGQNLAIEDTDGVINTYTYDPTGVHIANQNGKVVSYLKDWHNNIVGTVKQNGTVVESLDKQQMYDAWGNIVNSADFAPFGYTGEYHDSESGLSYLRNRYYDPETGRFISEDPIKDGLNWFVYAGNNPVMFVDPWGEDAIVILNRNGAQSSKNDDGNGISMGHMGIITQDKNGDWYYFSCGEGYVTFTKVEEEHMTDLNTFSEHYYWPGMYYTDATYIKGDFTASCKYFENYEKENSANNNAVYNLVLNNCATVVMNGLKKGVLKNRQTETEITVDKFLKEYGSSIVGIPNSQMASLQNIFYNTSFTYKESHKRINDDLWEAENGSWWHRIMNAHLAERLRYLH